MKEIQTQYVIDKRYRFLRNFLTLIISLDVFYFFACYILAQHFETAMWRFGGFFQQTTNSAIPILLKFTIIGLAAVSLPLVIQWKSLALQIRDSGGEIKEKMRKLESVDSAFFHYKDTYRAVYLALSFINIAAAAYYFAYGDFLVLTLVSAVGFANKIIVFPRSGGFNRWFWRALQSLQGPVAT